MTFEQRKHLSLLIPHIFASPSSQMPRLRVREAVLYMTRMADELHKFQVDRYLPAAEVTVLLLAIVTLFLR